MIFDAFLKESIKKQTCLDRLAYTYDHPPIV